MNNQEKAQFILAVISNENLQISAAMAKPMAECQEWLEALAGSTGDPATSGKLAPLAPELGVAKSK